MSEQEEFKGRAEKRVRDILGNIFDTYVQDQVHTKELMPHSEYVQIADDLQKPWDFRVFRIVGEVNYKHSSHAQRKWERIKPHLIDNNWIPLTIEGEYCPNLFRGDKYTHVNSWEDWIEVIQELKRNGINEKGEKIRK